VRAITVSGFGPPAVLVPSEVPTPVPGLGQLLVEVTGAGVGPWDAKMRRGEFGPHDFPYIPGDEVSGIVSAINGDTGGFAVGDTVFGSTTGMVGGYAEYVLVDAKHLAGAPRRLDLEAAGAVPVGGVTAIEGIDDHLHLNAGESVLVAGAAGGVGSFVVQIARARGARVVATASPTHHEFVRSLGADEVVDYHGDWVSTVRDVDAAFDCVGGDTWDGCLQAIRDGGRAVTIAASGRVEGHDPATASAFRASITPERLTEVAALIDEGTVTVAISERIPLDEAARAHEIIETGHTRGKLVLIPG
jgi:NADPH:quinone reductase-like Zn-dependent oxidoreductase